MTAAETKILRSFYRSRPGDAEHPGELVVILADRRELVQPIHRDHCFAVIRSAFDALFIPPGFKSNPADTLSRQTRTSSVETNEKEADGS